MMLGIILWSDRVKRKAVVWCNDHGDLAYVTENASVRGSDDLPPAGALCAVETRNEGNLRVCKSVTLLKSDALPDLPEKVRTAAGLA